VDGLNIFAVDSDPVVAARSLCDAHVVKMILESAQMLCAAHPQGVAPYKRSHYNHPCTIWARTNKANYEWLCQHGKALCEEYTIRYGKRHKSEDVIDWCMSNYSEIPNGSLTPHAQAMPDQYKKPCFVAAYRAYYIGEKSKFAKWKKRLPPEWYAK
jgi:hypothetical protein